jgi:HK97 family phage portal protein
VIHFRHGIDPYNPRVGISPLRAAYRELYTDNEAAGWSATLLRNTGIPGVIIAPKGTDVLANPDKIKSDYQAKFSGDRRGEPMVMTKPTDVYKLDWSPQEMDLTAIRRMPEERITALLGVPASVAGLGAGLDRNTFSNSEKEDDKAWHNNIIPSQRRFAATLQLHLLPLLGTPATERVSFDLSQVKALQDDASALYDRLAVAYNSGWLKRGEARQAAGWTPADDGSDDLYKSDLAPAAPPPMLPAPPNTPPPGKALAAPPVAKAAPDRQAAVQAAMEAQVRAWLAETYAAAVAEHGPVRNGHGG